MYHKYRVFDGNINEPTFHLPFEGNFQSCDSFGQKLPGEKLPLVKEVSDISICI